MASPTAGFFMISTITAMGGKRRMLSFQDCLRIGKIFVDVQVQQQYCFDLEKGE